MTQQRVSDNYDDELIQRFESNRADFEELVTLAPFCEHLYMSPGWVRPEFNHELKSREEKRCGELFVALNIKSVLVYERGMRGASSSTVRLSTSIRRGYAVSDSTMEPLFPDLNGNPREIGIRPYEYGYRHIEGNWYLYVVNLE